MNDIESDQSSDSVIRILRSLGPRYTPSYRQALAYSEMQADRLLSIHGVSTPAVPTEIITELPRIRVVFEHDLPVSGSAHWDGHDWIITINASEYELRRRFSLAHELKHVIDHPIRHLLQGENQMSARSMAEHVADHFAACLLMPRTWVHEAARTGMTVRELATYFQVSPKAMSYRLNKLSIWISPRRGDTPNTDNGWPPNGPRYFRTPPLSSGISP